MSRSSRFAHTRPGNLRATRAAERKEGRLSGDADPTLQWWPTYRKEPTHTLVQYHDAPVE